MKECKYCGTEYAEEYTECPNCGSPISVSSEEREQERKRIEEEKAIREAEKRKLDPRKKLLIAVAAAVIVIIGIVAVNISSTNATANRVVTRDGKTNKDLKVTYNQASTLIGDGKYEEGLELLDSIPEEYSDYNKVESKKKEAMDKYAQITIEKSGTYVEQGRYTDALALISHASGVVGDNDDLSSKREEVLEKCKTDYLAQAEEKLKSEDYDGAISLLTAVKDQIGEDAEVDAKLLECRKAKADKKLAEFDANADTEGAIKYLKSELGNLENDVDLNARLNSYISSYKEGLFKQAEEVYKKDGYEKTKELLTGVSELLGNDSDVEEKINLFTEDYKKQLFKNAEKAYSDEGYAKAVEVLQSGEKTLGNDSDVNDKLNYYKGLAPVALKDMPMIEGGSMIKVPGTTQDYDGNEYTDAISDIEASYLLGREYKGFRASIVGTLEKRDSMFGGVTIIADDKEIYNESILVSVSTDKMGERRLDLDVDLSGVNVVKIQKKHDWSFYTDSTVIVNAEFYK